MDRKFWNWAKNESGRELRLDGVISDYSWFDDDITPEEFRKELYADGGEVTVWINSPGGDVFAAAQIYNMLMEYPHAINVKIDGIAASAASVIAMAGGTVLMSPVSMMMIHNPSTMAWGDSEEMRRAKEMLDEVKESIINAYELKTEITRVKLAHMMDNETWMNAAKAVELGFADGIMYAPAIPEAGVTDSAGYMFNRVTACNTLIGKITANKRVIKPQGVPIDQLYKRLELLNR